MLDTLRLRQRVYTNIATGRAQRHEAQFPRGSASLERRWHAVVDCGADHPELHVRHLLDGTTLHRWSLPDKAIFSSSSLWRWGRHALAIPCACLPGPGILLVNLGTGQYTAVPLPVPEGFAEQDYPFPSEWSSTGLLLVELQSLDGATLSGLDCRGTVLTAVMPMADGVAAEVFPDSFGPDGVTAVLHAPGTPDLWHWNVKAGSAPVPHELQNFDLGRYFWSPDASRLLIGEQEVSEEDEGDRVLIWSKDRQVIQQIPNRFRTAAWVSNDRVAVAVDSSEGEAGSLCLYSVDDSGMLDLMSEVSLAPTCFRGPLAVSPDERYLVVATHSRGLARLRDGVAILDVQGHLLQLAALPFGTVRVQWSSVSGSVLLSDLHGSQYVLLDYI